MNRRVRSASYHCSLYLASLYYHLAVPITTPLSHSTFLTFRYVTQFLCPALPCGEYFAPLSGSAWRVWISFLFIRHICLVSVCTLLHKSIFGSRFTFPSFPSCRTCQTIILWHPRLPSFHAPTLMSTVILDQFVLTLLFWSLRSVNTTCRRHLLSSVPQGPFPRIVSNDITVHPQFVSIPRTLSCLICSRPFSRYTICDHTSRFPAYVSSRGQSRCRLKSAVSFSSQNNLLIDCADTLSHQRSFS